VLDSPLIQSTTECAVSLVWAVSFEFEVLDSVGSFISLALNNLLHQNSLRCDWKRKSNIERQWRSFKGRANLAQRGHAAMASKASVEYVSLKVSMLSDLGIIQFTSKCS